MKHGSRPEGARPVVAGALVLLIASLATACTVRLELASPRAVTGDLAASSAGLAGHERWLAGVPGETLARTGEGITIAAVAPPASLAVPEVELLPATRGRHPTREPARGALPEFRPEPRTAVARMAPAPPPAKPLLIAALDPGRPADRSPAATPIISGLMPAAGPAFAAWPEPDAARILPSPPKPARGARRGRIFGVDRTTPVLALGPPLDLAPADRRYDLAWLGVARARADGSAAAPDRPVSSWRPDLGAPAAAGSGAPLRRFSAIRPT